MITFPNDLPDVLDDAEQIMAAAVAFHEAVIHSSLPLAAVSDALIAFHVLMRDTLGIPLAPDDPDDDEPDGDEAGDH